MDVMATASAAPEAARNSRDFSSVKLCKMNVIDVHSSPKGELPGRPRAGRIAPRSMVEREISLRQVIDGTLAVHVELFVSARCEDRRNS